MGVHQRPSPRRRGAGYQWLYLMTMSHQPQRDHSGSNIKNKNSAREVEYRHTFETTWEILVDEMQETTRLGLRDEVAPPVVAGIFQLGLWKEVVSMGKKVHDQLPLRPSPPTSSRMGSSWQPPKHVLRQAIQLHLLWHNHYHWIYQYLRFLHPRGGGKGHDSQSRSGGRERRTALKIPKFRFENEHDW